MIILTNSLLDYEHDYLKTVYRNDCSGELKVNQIETASSFAICQIYHNFKFGIAISMKLFLQVLLFLLFNFQILGLHQ